MGWLSFIASFQSNWLYSMHRPLSLTSLHGKVAPDGFQINYDSKLCKYMQELSSQDTIFGTSKAIDEITLYDHNGSSLGTLMQPNITEMWNKTEVMITSSSTVLKVLSRNEHLSNYSHLESEILTHTQSQLKTRLFPNYDNLILRLRSIILYNYVLDEENQSLLHLPPACDNSIGTMVLTLNPGFQGGRYYIKQLKSRDSVLAQRRSLHKLTINPLVDFHPWCASTSVFSANSANSSPVPLVFSYWHESREQKNSIHVMAVFDILGSPTRAERKINTANFQDNKLYFKWFNHVEFQTYKPTTATLIFNILTEINRIFTEEAETKGIALMNIIGYNEEVGRILRREILNSGYVLRADPVDFEDYHTFQFVVDEFGNIAKSKRNRVKRAEKDTDVKLTIKSLKSEKKWKLEVGEPTEAKIQYYMTSNEAVEEMKYDKEAEIVSGKIALLVVYRREWLLTF